MLLFSHLEMLGFLDVIRASSLMCLFFVLQATSIEAKLKKICEAFKARVYPLPNMGDAEAVRKLLHENYNEMLDARVVLVKVNKPAAAGRPNAIGGKIFTHRQALRCCVLPLVVQRGVVVSWRGVHNFRRTLFWCDFCTGSIIPWRRFFGNIFEKEKEKEKEKTLSQRDRWWKSCSHHKSGRGLCRVG